MRVERLIGNSTDFERIVQLRWFANWLLQIGNGLILSDRVGTRNLIEMPPYMVCQSPEELRDTVFPNFRERHTDMEWLSRRVCLACRNDLIQQRNNEMIDMLPGDEFESVSIDFCMNDEDNRFYDSDTLNQQEVSGLPPHRLRLKKNACVILIRSLMPKKGFCNGKRCLVKGISNNLLILTPLDSNGPDILVPRLPMECTDSKLGIPFIRRQYPILLAYYLTINRSQGQTLDVVGVELPTSVFMHGQIYVSYGRTGDPVELHIFANQDEFHDIQDHLQAGKTYVKNVVWPELLIN
jgi:ATP-dependent DNA helicase PIF1